MKGWLLIGIAGCIDDTAWDLALVFVFVTKGEYVAAATDIKVLYFWPVSPPLVATSAVQYQVDIQLYGSVTHYQGGVKID